MEFRTKIEIERPAFQIEPLERMLFVGSCFADSIGRRFVEEQFRAVVNPYGVMYNPASVLHTVERWLDEQTQKGGGELPRVVFLTLGTNHVYRLKETGEIVDNCQKRPQKLFQEERLTVDECADYLQRAVALLRQRRPDVHIVLTVSPIRYQKYGFHESQLSKATLLLAAQKLVEVNCQLSTVNSQMSTVNSQMPTVTYFPAYEIVLDELRDYRFYKPDMLHPSEQTVEYIWQQLVECYFSSPARQFLDEWRPVKQALQHRPFNADSDDYQRFMDRTRQQTQALMERYPGLHIVLPAAP